MTAPICHRSVAVRPASEFLGETEPATSDELRQAAQNAKTADEFLWLVQQGTPVSGRGGLLGALYAWEYSTPENQKRFKMNGWFHTASVFWSEHHEGRTP